MRTPSNNDDNPKTTPNKKKSLLADHLERSKPIRSIATYAARVETNPSWHDADADAAGTFSEDHDKDPHDDGCRKSIQSQDSHSTLITATTVAETVGSESTASATPTTVGATPSVSAGCSSPISISMSSHPKRDSTISNLSASHHNRDSWTTASISQSEELVVSEESLSRRNLLPAFEASKVKNAQPEAMNSGVDKQKMTTPREDENVFERLYHNTKRSHPLWTDPSKKNSHYQHHHSSSASVLSSQTVPLSPTFERLYKNEKRTEPCWKEPKSPRGLDFTKHRTRRAHHHTRSLSPPPSQRSLAVNLQNVKSPMSPPTISRSTKMSLALLVDAPVSPCFERLYHNEKRPEVLWKDPGLSRTTRQRLHQLHAAVTTAGSKAPHSPESRLWNALSQTTSDNNSCTPSPLLLPSREPLCTALVSSSSVSPTKRDPIITSSHSIAKGRDNNATNTRKSSRSSSPKRTVNSSKSTTPRSASSNIYLPANPRFKKKKAVAVSSSPAPMPPQSGGHKKMQVLRQPWNDTLLSDGDSDVEDKCHSDKSKHGAMEPSSLYSVSSQSRPPQGTDSSKLQVQVTAPTQQSSPQSVLDQLEPGTPSASLENKGAPTTSAPLSLLQKEITELQELASQLHQNEKSFSQDMRADKLRKVPSESMRSALSVPVIQSPAPAEAAKTCPEINFPLDIGSTQFVESPSRPASVRSGRVSQAKALGIRAVFYDNISQSATKLGSSLAGNRSRQYRNTNDFVSVGKMWDTPCIVRPRMGNQFAAAIASHYIHNKVPAVKTALTVSSECPLNNDIDADETISNELTYGMFSWWSAPVTSLQKKRLFSPVTTESNLTSPTNASRSSDSVTTGNQEASDAALAWHNQSSQTPRQDLGAISGLSGTGASFLYPKYPLSACFGWIFLEPQR